MEVLNKNVFTSILAMVDDRELAILRGNSDIKETVDDIIKSNDFWKERLETSLGHYLNEFTSKNWKKHYLNWIEIRDASLEREGISESENEESKEEENLVLNMSALKKHAIQKNDVKLLDILVNLGEVDLNKKRNNFAFAATRADYKTIKYLSDKGLFNDVKFFKRFVIDYSDNSNQDPNVIELIIESPIFLSNDKVLEKLSFSLREILGNANYDYLKKIISTDWFKNLDENNLQRFTEVLIQSPNYRFESFLELMKVEKASGLNYKIIITKVIELDIVEVYNYIITNPDKVIQNHHKVIKSREIFFKDAVNNDAYRCFQEMLDDSKYNKCFTSKLTGKLRLFEMFLKKRQLTNKNIKKCLANALEKDNLEAFIFVLEAANLKVEEVNFSNLSYSSIGDRCANYIADFLPVETTSIREIFSNIRNISFSTLKKISKFAKTENDYQSLLIKALDSKKSKCIQFAASLSNYKFSRLGNKGLPTNEKDFLAILPCIDFLNFYDRKHLLFHCLEYKFPKASYLVAKEIVPLAEDNSLSVKNNKIYRKALCLGYDDVCKVLLGEDK